MEVRLKIPLSLLAITLAVFLLTPKYSFSQPPEDIKKSIYDLETATYYYTTGHYLKTAIISERLLSKYTLEYSLRHKDRRDMRNRALLLNIQSELILNHNKDEIEPFLNARFKKMPGLLDVFEKLYQRGEFSSIVNFNSKIRGPEADYLSALSLFKLGKFDSSHRALSNITPGDEIYPYARIMLAQIETLDDNYDEARSILSGLSRTLPKGELKNKVTLLTGYIDHEKGNYALADSILRTIPANSSFHTEALTARAWALASDGYYSKTLEIINKLKPLKIYDKREREVMALEVYAYIKTGEPLKARELAIIILDSLNELKLGYNIIANEKHIPDFFLMDLSQEDIDATFNEQDKIMLALRHNALKLDRARLKKAAAYFEAFRLIREQHEKDQLRLTLVQSLLKRKIEAKSKSINDLRTRINGSTAMLRGVGDTVLTDESGQLRYKKSGLSTTEIKLRWSRRLNRILSKNEERILDMVALDGKEGIWYLNNTQYCQFIYWMVIDDTKDDRKNWGTSRLEQIVVDMEQLKLTNTTELLGKLPEMEARVSLNIREDRKLLSKIEKTLKMVTDGSAAAKKAEYDSLNIIEEILVRRAGIAQFEMRPIEKNLTQLLEEIEKTLSKKDEKSK
ncbi:MAG: hypothetical protein KAR06_09070 [Deltaproteobacteria bacterium]|nr:hypothetical protein [Deltaproteobacteria bacterium]